MDNFQPPCFLLFSMFFKKSIDPQLILRNKKTAYIKRKATTYLIEQQNYF